MSALPTEKVLVRVARRIGASPYLYDLASANIKQRFGIELALTEALLHEAAHYLTAGRNLLVYVQGKNSVKPARVTERMFEAAVNNRLEEVSTYISDAEEIETCAIVQLAGVALRSVVSC